MRDIPELYNDMHRRNHKTREQGVWLSLCLSKRDEYVIRMNTIYNFQTVLKVNGDAQWIPTVCNNLSSIPLCAFVEEQSS